MSRERKNNRSKLGQANRNGEPLSGAGAAGGDAVQTREPVVTVRDPVMETFEAPRMPGVMIVKGDIKRCKNCGHRTFRKYADDNHSYETGNMERSKYCPHCGKSYVIVEPPTPQEQAARWKVRA